MSVDTVTIRTPQVFAPAVATSGIVTPHTSTPAVLASFTGDLLTLLPADITSVRAYLVPRVEAQPVSTDVRLGGLELTLSSTYTFSVSNVPVSFYRVRVTYYSTLWRKQQEWTSAEFLATDNGVLTSMLP